jgi:hypothetical protein
LFTHIPSGDIRVCLERLSRKVKPGGKLFATFFRIPEDHRPGEATEHVSGVRTFDAHDPYHYRASDMIRLCDGLPWQVTLASDFSHPRGQQMLLFTRTEESPQAVGEPSDEVRSLDYAAAANLPTGAQHYRAYVGPPDRFDFMSATQFALLFALGLRDHHRVLDFGCGSLRLGRLYATTGARILLDVSIDGHPMGSELACSTSPSIHVDVVGTSDIAVVQILRSGDGVVYELRPGDGDVSRRSVRFDWTDRDLRGPRRVAYTLRVVQTDDELAVSSPIACDVSA